MSKDYERVPQITIGADYFRTTVRKESSYPLAWRWLKETLQNSVDAGASKFTVNLYMDEQAMEVVDNGSGMDADTLLDVFLAIGGSKKEPVYDDYQAIGGFGDAKKVVCFCWDRWEIHTQDNYLNNELMGVKLKRRKYRDGTRIKVWMGSEFDVQQVFAYLGLCQLDINIEINFVQNDEITKTTKVEKLRRNRLINDLGFARLYVNKSAPTEKLVVRINGLALFVEPITGIKATCVLELDSVVDPKSKAYMLNVTREQLTWVYRQQVHSVIIDMLSDPVRALKPRKEKRVVVMKGMGACQSVTSASTSSTMTKITVRVNDFIERFSHEDVSNALEEARGRVVDITVPVDMAEKVQDFVDGMNYADLLGLLESSSNEPIDALKTPILMEVLDGQEKNALQQVFPYDIIIKGSTKKRYDGVKYQRLLLAWHKAIQYVCYYNTWNETPVDLGDYKVGFVFDDDVLAERCVLPSDGVCYLLNPSDLNFQYYSWRGIILELIDRASHEIAHSFEPEHNGNFVSIWNSLKSYCYMYIDDIMYSIGAIIKSTQKDLVKNANLSEDFDL